MIVALDINELNPGLSSKFGVEAKHVYREGDLVDDALAARLACGPKFEIGRIVIRSIPIQVMNIFSGHKRTAKNFLHFNPVDPHVFSVTLNDMISLYTYKALSKVFVFSRGAFRIAMMCAVLLVGFCWRNKKFFLARKTISKNYMFSSFVCAGARAIYWSVGKEYFLGSPNNGVSLKLFAAMRADQIGHWRTALNTTRHIIIVLIAGVDSQIARLIGSVYINLGDYPCQ